PRTHAVGLAIVIIAWLVLVGNLQRCFWLLCRLLLRGSRFDWFLLHLSGIFLRHGDGEDVFARLAADFLANRRFRNPDFGLALRASSDHCLGHGSLAVP